MIVELSKFNSLTTFSNSDWINSFQPLTIQPQGTLSFKGGFLDYNTSSAQVIELQEDVDITIQVGFYMVCPYIESPVNNSGTFGNIYASNVEYLQPFDLFVARDKTTYQLITSDRQFTIPAGNYSPDEIVEILNFNCVNIKSNEHGSGDVFNNIASNNFFRSTLLDAYTCALEPSPQSDSESAHISLFARDPTQLQYFNVGDDIVILDFDRGAGDPQTPQFKIGTINQVTGEITTVPPYPAFSPYTSLNQHMIKYLLYPQEPDDKNINNANCVRFYRQATTARPFDPSANFYFDPNVERQVAMMGASQIQFEYNYNNNALFQVSYLHTPFYTTAGDEAIDLFLMGSPLNNVFQYINTVTGCFFTNLEPKSFWQDIMGFDLPTLIVEDVDVTHRLNAPLIAGKNITGNLVTYDALFDKTRTPLQYLPNGSNSDTYYKKNVQASSSQTIPIPATKTQGITTSSFYLIELGGLSDVNMVNDTDLFRTICAIGSKEYSTQGIISIYPDGTSFYTNNSPEPMYLSSFRVRILDSLTKQPSNTLGGRNSVFVELINPQAQPIQQESDKKDEKKKST